MLRRLILFLIAVFLALWIDLARAAETAQNVATCGTPTGLTYNVPGIGNITIDTNGRLCINAVVTSTVAGPGIPSSTATSISANNTGTTAAVAVSLPAAVGKTTYICGYQISAAATAATLSTASINNPISTGLWTIEQAVAATPALAINQQLFTPCVPANAQNTAITVTSAAAGTGGVTSVLAWGYQQ